MAPNLFHAVVDGTTQYDVDIRFKGDAVASVACTCPYEGWCKHAAAVVLAVNDMRDREQGTGAAQSVSSVMHSSSTGSVGCFPRGTYDSVMAFLTSYAESGSLEQPKTKTNDVSRSVVFESDFAKELRLVIRSLSGSKDPVESLTVDQAGRMLSSALLDPDTFERRYDSVFEWDEASADIGVVARVLANARFCEDPGQGALIALSALEPLSRSIECHHEMDDGESEAIQEALSVFDVRCEELASSYCKGLWSSLFCMVVGPLKVGSAADWVSHSSLLWTAFKLARSHREYAELLNMVKTEEDSSCRQEEYVALHYKILVDGGFKKEARAFEKAHELSSFFLLPKFGVDMASELVNSIRDMYKNRRALIEELEKLEQSWE